MQPRIRPGLIVGVAGLLLNVCVAGFLGSALCFGVVGALPAAAYLATTGQPAPPSEHIISS
jgi:hypothetical protein